MADRKRIDRIAKIALPSLLVLITIVAFSYYAIRSRENVLANAYEVAMRTSSERIKTLSAELDGRFTTLEAYARAFAADADFSFDAPTTRALLGDIQDGDYTFDLFLLDGNGKGYVSNERSLDASDRAYFRESIAGNRAIENLETGRLSGLPRVVLAVPLARDGAIVGAVAATFDMHVFRNLLIPDIEFAHGYSFVTDGDGTILLSSDDAFYPPSGNIFDNMEGDANAKMARDLLQGHDGQVSYTTNDQDHFAVYRHTGINDWTMFHVVSERGIDQSVFDTTRMTFFITISVMTLSVTMLVIVYWNQARATRQLRLERLDFRAAAMQSGRMLRMYDIRTNRLVNLYRENALAWADTPERMVDDGNVAPESVQAYLAFFESIRTGAKNGAANARIKDAHGNFHWYHAEYTRIDMHGKPDHAVITILDNTETMQRELAYRMRNSELAALKDESVFYMEANLMTCEIERLHRKAAFQDAQDARWRNLYALLEWEVRERIYVEDERRFRDFFDQNRLIALHTAGVFTDSMDLRTLHDGKILWLRATVQMVEYPYTNDIKVYVVANDVTEDYLEHELLIGLASNDSLTGLYNREVTMLEIEKYLHGEGMHGTHALFMVDIDNFKTINDTLGHQRGDDVLIDLAASIRRSFRETDIVGRIGGDEFFAFMKDVAKPGIVQEKARELLTEMQHIYASGRSQMELTGSIGITLYHGDMQPPKPLNILYAEADAALYKAKELGRNRFAFADDLDAVEATPTNDAARGEIAINLRDLLRNLGGGIKIYRLDAHSAYTLLFYNAGFLKLIGGLSEGEFHAIYGQDALSGVHPEDRAPLREAFMAAYQAHAPLQRTYRLLGKGDRYYRITATANIVRHEDGSCDVYAIYTDASTEHAQTYAENEKPTHA